MKAGTSVNVCQVGPGLSVMRVRTVNVCVVFIFSELFGCYTSVDLMDFVIKFDLDAFQSRHIKSYSLSNIFSYTFSVTCWS